MARGIQLESKTQVIAWMAVNKEELARKPLTSKRLCEVIRRGTGVDVNIQFARKYADMLAIPLKLSTHGGIVGYKAAINRRLTVDWLVESVEALATQLGVQLPPKPKTEDVQC